LATASGGPSAQLRSIRSFDEIHKTGHVALGFFSNEFEAYEQSRPGSSRFAPPACAWRIDSRRILAGDFVAKAQTTSEGWLRSARDHLLQLFQTILHDVGIEDRSHALECVNPQAGTSVCIRMP